jgi:hexosaminidase
MKPTLLLLICCFVGACESKGLTKQFTQTTLDTLAQDLNITVAVDSNVNVDDCPGGEQAQCYLAHFDLTFPTEINNSNWTIYFSQTTPIEWDGSADFDIEHINGDLHIIKPLRKDFVVNQPYVISFKGPGSLISESDFMPNFFIVSQGLEPRLLRKTIEIPSEKRQLLRMPHVGDFIRDQQTRRNSKDNIPLATPAYLYEQNDKINSQHAKIGEHNNRIIPKISQPKWQTTRLDMQKGLNLTREDQVRFAPALTVLQQKGVGYSAQGIDVKLIKKPDQALGSQGYRLDIQARLISVYANNDTGLYYGLTSLGQLLDPSTLTVPIGQAKDVAEYDFRGLHLDIARNFHSKAFILKLLDQMAHYKINKLQLHMADDEGWRLQIPGLPELTEVGGFRCFDPSEEHCLLPQLGSGPFRDTKVNGYLSTADYKEILKFADQRHIEVIPALDMPGHSRAAVKSMLARYKKYKRQEETAKAEQYLLSEFADPSIYSSIQHYNDNTLNPCISSTYAFVEKIIDEVSKLHAEAGVPLKRYHVGADETAGAWKDSPACQQLIAENKSLDNAQQLSAYFVAKVVKMVSDKGFISGAWSDGLSHVDPVALPANIQANIWDTLYSQGHNRAHEFANRNWDTILSLPDVLYFDFPHQADPQELGYYWGSRYIDSFKVFQFMPQNLPANAELWRDKMGDPYTATETVSLNVHAKIRGIQAQLWSETVRTDDAAEYLLYPRLFAFAERAWHKPEWALPYQAGQSYSAKTMHFSAQRKQQQLNDWAGFSDIIVNKVMPQLMLDDVLFRIPTPGAKIVDGILHANSYFPGLVILYRQSGGNWQEYQQPVAADGPIEVKTVLSNRSRSSRITPIK